MNTFKKIIGQEENIWHSLAIRAGLVFLTSFIIIWFLPRNEAKQYAYEIGEPWHYGTLIAKFDFPVYKTDETVQRERDSLLHSFQPYYNYDNSVESVQTAKLRVELAKAGTLPPGFAQALIEKLHQLYQTGIMGTPQYNSFNNDTTSQIRVVFGKDAESRKVSLIYSTMTAYELLLDDSYLSKERLLMQRLNMNDYIMPNLILDRNRTETARNDLLSGITPASGMVMAGQKIIGQGDMVDDYNYRVLNSMEKEIDRRQAGKSQITRHFVGNIIYVIAFMLLFTLYLTLFRRDYFSKPRCVAMLYTFIALFPLCVSLMMEHSYFSFSVYVLPFAMGPIFVRIFLDSRTAFVTHLITVLISACALRYQFDFIIIQTIAGLIAIYSLREVSTRSQIFRTALWVFVATCAMYFALKLMESNGDMRFGRSMYYHFLINGVLLLLAYPLMFVVEKTFGFVSVLTLIELSDTNKGLLRKLSEIAPGTFQHSITVGNLASEIANKIGAKATLARTGALYHDIGKIKNPAFFTENQQGGMNPHDNLTEKESARIIIAHVTDGVKLAEEYDLPVVIRDFILTHHGCGMSKYFYIKYQNEHPNEVVDKSPFTYPGPNPSTREQAILMMADSCEAASHSLKEYTEESIAKLVNQLVDQQVKDGLFSECKITFYDIAVAKQVLIERLKAIYHTRIKYPERIVKE
ncbi:MAG: HDIG domain-containing protein [Prevotella sp.]|nr:HDIG domain-containing protein [Prevotella sp.]MDY5314323.1 HDIG domain-containing protein [Prevotella sp.]